MSSSNALSSENEKLIEHIAYNMKGIWPASKSAQIVATRYGTLILEPQHRGSPRNQIVGTFDDFNKASSRLGFTPCIMDKLCSFKLKENQLLPASPVLVHVEEINGDELTLFKKGRTSSGLDSAELFTVSKSDVILSSAHGGPSPSAIRSFLSTMVQDPDVTVSVDYDQDAISSTVVVKKGAVVLSTIPDTAKTMDELTEVIKNLPLNGQLLEMTMTVKGRWSTFHDEDGFQHHFLTAEDRLSGALYDIVPTFVMNAIAGEVDNFGLDIGDLLPEKNELIKAKLLTETKPEYDPIDDDNSIRKKRFTSESQLPPPPETELTLIVWCHPSLPLINRVTQDLDASMVEFIDDISSCVSSVAPGALQRNSDPIIKHFIERAIDDTAGIETHQMVIMLQNLHKELQPPFSFEKLDSFLSVQSLQFERESSLSDAILTSAAITNLETYIRAKNQPEQASENTALAPTISAASPGMKR